MGKVRLRVFCSSWWIWLQFWVLIGCSGSNIWEGSFLWHILSCVTSQTQPQIPRPELGIHKRTIMGVLIGSLVLPGYLNESLSHFWHRISTVIYCLSSPTITPSRKIEGFWEHGIDNAPREIQRSLERGKARKVASGISGIPWLKFGYTLLGSLLNCHDIPGALLRSTCELPDRKNARPSPNLKEKNSTPVGRHLSVAP